MIKKILLPAIVLIALVMRLWNYTATALWHDEAFSALLIRMPFDEMMHRIGLDVHPPFYYWLLDFWAIIFGHSLASLRGFSVLFGVGTVIMLYVLIRSLSQNRKLALAASALLAVNPFHIQYSLEARMYTLGTFLVVASTWMLFHALQTNKWKWWLSYALLTTASALTHYFMLFSIAAQGLYVLVWWLKKYGLEFLKMRLRAKEHVWRPWASFLLAFVLYTPWLPTFWKQFNQVQENYWIPAIDIWSIPSTIWKILLGGWQGAGSLTLIVSTALFVVMLTAFLLMFKFQYRAVLAFSVVVPFVLAILASLMQSIFLDRYFIFAAVFAIAMVAMVLIKLGRRFGVFLLVSAMIASVISYGIGWRKLEANQRPGMAAASEYVLSHFPISCPPQTDSKDDKIIVASTFIYFNYQYYYNLYLDPIKNASLACEVPIAPRPKLYLQGLNSVSQLPHFSGTALLEEQDLTGELTQFTKSGETVWLLWTTGFSGRKPDVPSNWTQLEEKKFPDVFYHRGEIFVTKYIVR